VPWQKYIQRYRLFLQATTVADITTSYGTKLAPWATTYRADNPRSSIHIYPNQARPNCTVWNVFVKQLWKCFCQGTNDRLNQPLGRWYQGCISQTWPQVYSPSTRLLYNAEPNGSIRLYRSRRRGTTYRHIRWARQATTPRDAVPVSGSFQQGHFHPDDRDHCTMTAPLTIPNEMPHPLN